MITTAATVLGILVVCVLAIGPWLIELVPDGLEPATSWAGRSPRPIATDDFLDRAA